MVSIFLLQFVSDRCRQSFLLHLVACVCSLLCCLFPYFFLCKTRIYLFFFHLYLYEKATVVLYFGRIRTHLGVRCPFPSFFGCWFDFFPVNLLLVRSHQAEIIIVKRLSRSGWEFNPVAYAGIWKGGAKKRKFWKVNTRSGSEALSRQGSGGEDPRCRRKFVILRSKYSRFCVFLNRFLTIS